MMTRIFNGSRSEPILCVIVAVLAHALTASAATLKIPQDFATISAAISAAGDGDTIELSPGVYFEANIVVGAAAPSHLVFRGATGNRNDVTLNGIGQNWLFAIEAGRSASFGGMTFANASSGSNGGIGSALTVSAAGRSSDLIVQNCRFVNCALVNNSAGSGGAIYFGFSGRLDIRDCLFESNRTDNLGGAVFVVDSSCDIRNSQFLNNIGGRQGGAVWFGEQTTASVTGCLFMGNILTSVNSVGGALWVGPATVDLVDSSIAQNDSYFGPSLAVDHGVLRGLNCDLDQAGYINGGARVTMTCCVLGDLVGWNLAPVVDNNGCVVPEASTAWGTVKSMFR